MKVIFDATDVNSSLQEAFKALEALPEERKRTITAHIWNIVHWETTAESEETKFLKSPFVEMGLKALEEVQNGQSIDLNKWLRTPKYLKVRRLKKNSKLKCFFH